MCAVEMDKMFNRLKAIAINTSNYNISLAFLLHRADENVLTLFIYTLYSESN